MAWIGISRLSAGVNQLLRRWLAAFGAWNNPEWRSLTAFDDEIRSARHSPRLGFGNRQAVPEATASLPWPCRHHTFRLFASKFEALGLYVRRNNLAPTNNEAKARPPGSTGTRWEVGGVSTQLPSAIFCRLLEVRGLPRLWGLLSPGSTMPRTLTWSRVRLFLWRTLSIRFSLYATDVLVPGIGRRTCLRSLQTFSEQALSWEISTAQYMGPPFLSSR